MTGRADKPNRSKPPARRLWRLFVLVVMATGCQQKMADQPSFKTYEASDFFADGRSARSLVQGTVARGRLRIDKVFFTGRTEETNARRASNEAPTPAAAEKNAKGFDESRAFVAEFPLPITEAVLIHGLNRFTIYCAVCHDPLGTGRGKIVQRGYTKPPSYHIDRLREAPVGRLFAIVSEGYGSMPSYAAQIPPEDRWAIVAYVRALQLSQHFPADELTPAMRAALNQESKFKAPLDVLLPSKEASR